MAHTKTICKRGHDMTDPAVLRIGRDGKRHCRLCHRERARLSAAQRRGRAPIQLVLAKQRQEIIDQKTVLYEEALEHLTKDQTKKLFWI